MTSFIYHKARGDCKACMHINTGITQDPCALCCFGAYVKGSNDLWSPQKQKLVEKPEKCPNCGSDEIHCYSQNETGVYRCSKCDFRRSIETGEEIKTAPSLGPTILQGEKMKIKTKMRAKPTRCPKCRTTGTYSMRDPEGFITEYRCRTCDWEGEKIRPQKQKLFERPEKCPNCGSKKIAIDIDIGLGGVGDRYFCVTCSWRINSQTGNILNKGEPQKPFERIISEKTGEAHYRGNHQSPTKPFERPEKCPNCNSVAIFHVCGVPKHHKSRTWCVSCGVTGPAQKGHIVCDDCGWGVDAETGEAAFSGDVNEPQKEPTPRDTPGQVTGPTGLGDEVVVAIEGSRNLMNTLKEKPSFFNDEFKKQIGFRVLLRPANCSNCAFTDGVLCGKWAPIAFRHGGDCGWCGSFQR